VQWWLANLLSDEQDWQAALGEWKSYRANFPDEANRSIVMVPLAQAYIGENDFDPARQLAEQVLKQNPEGEFNARGRLLLGDIAFSQKKFDEAAKTYSAVALLMDDPVLTPIALKKSEVAYRQAGKTAQADQAALDLARRYPDKR
jgi:lipopolysaccharide biosynthesis regulator YciM